MENKKEEKMERTITREEGNGTNPKGETWFKNKNKKTKTRNDRGKKDISSMEENISWNHKTIAYIDFMDYMYKLSLLQRRNYEKIKANNLNQTSRNIYQMLTAC